MITDLNEALKYIKGKSADELYLKTFHENLWDDQKFVKPFVKLIEQGSNHCYLRISKRLWGDYKFCRWMLNNAGGNERNIGYRIYPYLSETLKGDWGFFEEATKATMIAVTRDANDWLHLISMTPKSLRKDLRLIEYIENRGYHFGKQFYEVDIKRAFKYIDPEALRAYYDPNGLVDFEL